VARLYGVETAIREHTEAQRALAWAFPLMTESAAKRSVPPGEWSAAMNLAHLALYEERVAIPVLAAASRGEDGATNVRSSEEGPLEGAARSLAAEDFALVVRRYEDAAQAHAQVLARFDDESFNEPRCSLWSPAFGLVCAGWVAKKSIQHTWEHGHIVIRAAFFLTVYAG
jgi:hypothetical protein